MTEGPIVYIPTYRRTEKQMTWESLSPKWQARAVLVCDAEDAIELLDYPTLVCPISQGIGLKRQWILDQHDLSDGESILVLDDDLKEFSARRFDNPGRFLSVKTAEGKGIVFDRLLSMLDQVRFAGVLERSGGNREVAPVVMGKRIFEIHGIHVPTFRAENIRFDRVTLMEDFDAALQVMLAGYPTAVLSTHTKGSVRGAPGGCSVFRDAAAQAAAAEALCALHPDYVRLTTRPGWNGDPEPRVDVYIKWSQALKAGCAARTAAGRAQEPEPDWSQIAPEWDLF